MKKTITSLFILLNLLATIHGQKEQIKFMHLRGEDGLSQNFVTCIFQDSRGFMWFGTGGNGINRYDGYSFKIYKNDLKDRNTLLNNWIITIFEASNHKLFVGTQQGLHIYDQDNDNFKRIQGLQNVYVNGITQLNDSILCIVIAENIIYLNINNYSTTLFCDDYQCFHGIVFTTGLAEDKFGNHWLGSTVGLFQVNLKDKTIKSFLPEKNNPRSISDNSIGCVYADADKQIWIGTVGKGLSLVQFSDNDPQKPYFNNFTHDIFSPSTIASGKIQALLDDKQGNLWIGTENGGLDILDLKSVKEGKFIFRHYIQNIYDETSLSNNSVYSLLKDKQSTIWIGTYGGGINYYNKLLFKFDHYKQIPGIENGLNNNLVNVFYEIGDDLYIGTEGGLNIMNKVSGEFKHYTHDPKNPASIGSDAVWAIFKDSRGTIWIGTWAGGLNRFNPVNGTFTRYMHSIDVKNCIGSDNVFGICEDEEGYIWVATMNGGLNRYDYKTNSFLTLKADFQKPNSISGDWVQTIMFNSRKELWLSTSQGIDIYDKRTGLFKHFIHDTADAKSISYNSAHIIFEDSKGNMWFGTDAGLNVLIRKDSSFLHYDEKDGLPDASIKGICEDGLGNLWLSTNNGLSKFIEGVNIPVNPKFTNYTTEDGLQGNEFNRRSCFKDSQGYLYFGGSNGYNVFDPRAITSNPVKPEIYFTDFLIFNQPVKPGDKKSVITKHISECDRIVLLHNYNVFTIEYAALNYIAPQKNNYKYILEGFEKKWNDAGNKRSVTYTNLNQGEYTFRVKASNNDGVWNEEGISIKIKILPPWWKTWLFRILSGLLIIALIVAFYLYRVDTLRRQKEQLQVMVTERTKEIEEKNIILQKQSSELTEINVILEERQEHIEEQAEELKSQAEELLEANINLTNLNATKDKFFSIIAHDLKNPFTTVLGFCEVLLAKYDKYDDTKRKHLIGIIDQSANNIYKLLDNLLQWSRSQTGSLKFEPEEFEINELIMNNIILAQSQMEEKQITAKTNMPPGVRVYADRNMINTVLRNLISNAVKYTEAGEIMIQLEKNEKYVTVSVKDTGVGMKEEIANSLFIIGGVKSQEGTRGEPGTGLGLMLCKDFIERNGGNIGVESQLNKGSTFYFTLPISS